MGTWEVVDDVEGFDSILKPVTGEEVGSASLCHPAGHHQPQGRLVSLHSSIKDPLGLQLCKRRYNSALLPVVAIFFPRKMLFISTTVKSAAIIII